MNSESRSALALSSAGGTGSRAAAPPEGLGQVSGGTDHGRSATSRLTDHEDYRALRPFFRVVEQALAGIVDGADFFDILDEDVVVDYLITVPSYPRRVVGRDAVAELYRPYGSRLTLERCFDLVVHRDRESGVVVLEYASEGRAVATGARYANRFVSVLTIAGRKVVGWRDYLDPLAVFDALGWPERRSAPRARG